MMGEAKTMTQIPEQRCEYCAFELVVSLHGVIEHCQWAVTWALHDGSSSCGPLSETMCHTF